MTVPPPNKWARLCPACKGYEDQEHRYDETCALPPPNNAEALAEKVSDYRKHALWALETTGMAKSGYAPRKAQLAKWVVELANELVALANRTEALEIFAAEMSGLISDMGDVPDPGLDDLPGMAKAIRAKYTEEAESIALAEAQLVNEEHARAEAAEANATKWRDMYDEEVVARKAAEAERDRYREKAIGLLTCSRFGMTYDEAVAALERAEP